MSRQIEDVKRVAALYGKAQNAIQGKLFRNEGIWLVWQFYFAQVCLYRYLPAAGSAEIQFIIRISDDVTDMSGHVGIIGQPPYKYMRI